MYDYIEHQAAFETSLSGRDGFRFEGCTFLISSAATVDTVNTDTHLQYLDSNDIYSLCVVLQV